MEIACRFGGVFANSVYMNEPLVICQDAAVLSLVQSAAAAAGISVQICEASGGVRRAWAGASLVIVGVDQAAAVAGLGLPERGGVHVVGTDAEAVLAWSVPLSAPGLTLPSQAGFLASLLDDAHRPSSSLGTVLRLFGATGGLGTSTLALGLAVRAARRGRRVAVVELDATGGGLDVMGGVEGEPGWRWGDLTAARGHVDDLTDHLPSVLGVSIVAASREVATAPPEAVAAVLASLRRTHDLVVLDQGRVSPAHEDTVLVVGADVRAVLAGQAVLAGGLATTRAVVRTGPGRRLPLDLVAESLGVVVAGVFPHDGRLPLWHEAGDPPGRANGKTARALDKLLDRLVPALALPTRGHGLGLLQRRDDDAVPVRPAHRGRP